MNRLIVVVCLLFLVTSARSQDLDLEQHSIDSVSGQIARCGNDTNKVNLLLRLAYHTYWFDTSSARDYVSDASVLSQKLNYTGGLARCFMMRGNFAEYSKNYTDALKYYQSAALHAENGKCYTETQDAYLSMINMHFYRGEYVYAHDVCLRGLRLAQQADDLPREANYTNLSGFIYRNMKQSADEERAFRDYAVLAEKSGDSLLIASACTELAQVMMEQRKFDSAELYLDTAYRLYSGHYETHRRAFIHYLRAKISLETGVREAALTNAKLAISISKSAPADEFDVARYYIVAGKALFQMRLFDEALLYLDTGLMISERIQHKENMRDAYQLIAYSFDHKGESDSAYHYLSLYNSLQDSLLNEENLRTIAEMKAKYDLDQQKAAFRKLEEEAEAKAEKEEQDQLIRNLGTGLISLLLVTGFLFYNRFRLKQKSALQLTINKQQKEMFQGILSAQEKERQRIASDLHDGLGSLLSSAKLQLQLMNTGENFSAEQQKHYALAAEMVDRSAIDLRNISHAIMPASLTKMGLSAALQNVINGLNAATGTRFTFHSYNAEKRPGPETELALYNIIMELINNVVKHSEATEATVQIVGHEDTVTITVDDNGKGIGKLNSSHGIGLSNIRSRIDYLKGSIEIDSVAGRGTSVSIEVGVS